jgi:hypothetical protein
MKPSQVEYSNFTVRNTATNPLNVYKTITGITTDENGTNDPENKWYTANPSVSPKNDIDTVIDYDLSAKLYHGTQLVWEQVLYKQDQTISQIQNNPIMLGMIPAGVDWRLDVVESYHMQAGTDNWAQSDKMTFNIEVKGQQLTGTVILEDKDTADWRVKGETATKGTLTYGVKDDKFNYNLSVVGAPALVDGAYTLVAWEDSTYAWTWNTSGARTVLANITIAGGTGSTSGNLELGADLTNAKVFLVPGNLGTPGTTGVILPWTPGSTLFETGLVTYYNSI